MPLGLLPYTESGNPEWDRLLKAREQGLDRAMRQMALGLVIHHEIPQVSMQEALGAADPLLKSDPAEQEHNLAEWSKLRYTDRNHLLGGADFWGIADPQRMRPEELEAVIDQHRQTMYDPELFKLSGIHSLRDVGEHIKNAYAIGAGILGTGVANAVLDLAQSVPFMGDAISRTKAVQSADEWLSKLQEGFTTELSPTDRKIGTGTAGMVGYMVPASLSWKLMGLLGDIPAVAAQGARMSPLARGAVRGIMSQALLTGGGDAPLSQRALDAGFGAAFGAGDYAGGFLGRTVAGAGLGAIVGAIADDHDPRTTLIGAAVGAAAMNGAPLLARKLARSFPTRSFGGIETEFVPQDFREPTIDVGGEPFRMSEAPQLPSGPRLLGPSGNAGELPAGLYEMPPPPGTVGPSLVGQTPPEVRSFVRRVVGERRAAQRAAETDALTGVGNRAAWERARGSAEADPGQAIVVFDLNNLKAANDLVGHEFGDQMIQRTVGAAQKSAEQAGVPHRLFRLGGDEFAAIVPSERAELYRAAMEENYGAEPAGQFNVSLTGATGQTFAEADAGLNQLKLGRKGASGSYRPLGVEEAAREAANLSKSATVLESPALADLSAQQAFDDSDVAKALVESYPGHVGVVRNVGDVGGTVRRILSEQMPQGVGPQDFRVVQRRVRPPVRITGYTLEKVPLSHYHSYTYEAETPAGPLFGEANVFPAGRVVMDVWPTNAKALYGEGQIPGQLPLGPGQVRQYGEELIRQLEARGHQVEELGGERVTGVRVGDPGNVFLPRSFFARTQPEYHNDLLVTSGRPITDKMVQEYEQHGMFSGQRATTAQGNEVTILELGPETSRVAPLHGGAEHIVPTADLLPGKASGLADVSAPDLYRDFEQFAYVRLTQQSNESGLTPIDLYGDEAATLLPQLMREYTQIYGLPEGYHEATLRQVLEQEHLSRLRAMIPEEDATLLRNAQSALQQEQLAAGLPEASLAEKAEARMMTWVQGPGDSGVLRHQLSDLEIPVASREAAEEILHGFDPETPDVSPATLIPPEVVGSPIGYNPASNLPNRYVDAADEARSMEADLNLVEDISDTFDNSWMDATDEQWINQMLDQEEAFNNGPGWGGHLPPPPPPRTPLGAGPEGPFLPGRADRFRIHDEQWYRLRRDNPQAYGAFLRAMDSFVTNVLQPYRNAAMGIEQKLFDLGITEGRVWQSYDAVETAHTRAISQAIPWQQRLSEIVAKVRNRYARDGTFREVYTAPTVNDRQRLLQKYGFTPAERQALGELRSLIDEHYFTEGRRLFPEMGYIENYWPTRVIRDDVPMSASSLPNELVWQRQLHRREGGEIDPSITSAFGSYFRSFYKYTEMKQPYEEMKRLFNQPNVPKELKDFTNEWLEARFWGIDPSQDKAIRGIRKVFNTVGIPMTHRDVTQLLGTGFQAQYRGMLGGRIDPVVRDLLQMLVPAARLGDFKLLGEVLKDFGSNPAARHEMIDWAHDSGTLQRQYTKVSDVDLFTNTAFENRVSDRDTRFTPEESARRESMARVGDFFTDRVMKPIGMPSGIRGTLLDPLVWYEKQGDMARVVSGELGRRRSTAALQRYSAELPGATDEFTYRALRDKLLKESGVIMYQAPIKRQYMELVDAGDYDGATKMFANQVANSQNRYGATESPVGVRKAGLMGRLYMQLGTHAQQQLNEHIQVINDSSIPRLDRLGYMARMASIDASLGVAKAATGWNFRKLMILGGLLSPIAAPTMWSILNSAQRALAWMKQQSGDPLSPDQKALLGAAGAPNQGILSSFDPTAGFRRTLSNLPEQLTNAHPFESTARYLVTGQRGDPVFERSLMSGWNTSAPPIPVAHPGLPTGIPAQFFGTQNVDSILAQYPGGSGAAAPSNGVTDPSRIYEKNGGPVYDTDSRTRDGRVPTHSLTMPSGRRPSETWEGYEQRVLATPDSAFSPAAQQVDSSITSLQPDVQGRLMALIQTAAAQGINLSVGETKRSTERQEWLFKDGRSPDRGGAPVTWTLTSSHATGRAADLRASSQQGYEWIQQNAARFGLSTLGSFDPGHVFMPEPQQPQQATQSAGIFASTGGGAF